MKQAYRWTIIGGLVINLVSCNSKKKSDDPPPVNQQAPGGEDPESPPFELDAAILSMGLAENELCSLFEGGKTRCWNREGVREYDLGAGELLARGRNILCVYTPPDQIACRLSPGTPIETNEDFRFAGVKKLVAGDDHICALADGQLGCFGTNTWGQATVPTLVAPVDVSAGKEHSCVLDEGKLKCWGRFDGVTKLGTPEDWDYPDGTAIASGSTYACVKTPGEVSCLGHVSYGFPSQATIPEEADLAISSLANDLCYQTPTAFKCLYNADSSRPDILSHSLPDNAQNLALGYSTFCYTIDKTISCLGENNHQLAIPPTITNAKKVVLNDERFVGQACAILEDGGITCWGSGPMSQAPIESSNDALDVVMMYRGNTCVLKGSSMSCHAAPEAESLDIPQALDENILLTGTSPCVKFGGAVQCMNFDGTGWSESTLDPTTIKVIHNASLDCSLTALGSASCSKFPSLLTQAKLDGLGVIDDMDAYEGNLCAVHEGRSKVTCFNDTGIYYGRITTTPTFTNIRSVQMGRHVLCTLDDTGVRCFSVLDTIEIKNVPSLKSPRFLEVEQDNACAIDESGVVCWGKENFGSYL